MGVQNGGTLQLENYENTTTEKNSYFKTEVVWPNVIGFAILHLFLLYGSYLLFSFQICSATVYWTVFVAYFGSEGITMGAHRMWAHKSYKGKSALKFVLMIAQTIAGQNCIWIWARDHRLHHKYSDTDADPHNSSRGFFFCHMGWLMMKKHPEVMAKGKSIDMSDLNADPYVMFQKKYYKSMYLIFALIIPIAVPVFFWDESFKNAFFICYVFRYLASLHGTWTVNSIAHFYGLKPYTKNIAAVESDFVALISLGEGWHNYHHTFPWDYRAGEYGKYWNITASIIELLGDYGYAYDLRTATPEMILHRIAKKGDGSHLFTCNKMNNGKGVLELEVEDIFGEKIEKHINVSKTAITN